VRAQLAKIQNTILFIYNSINIQIEYNIIMAKRLSITSDQKEALVEFMENHPDLRKGKFSINFTTAIAKSQWEECRILLNSIPGPAKEWQEWRKVIINISALYYMCTN